MSRIAKELIEEVIHEATTSDLEIRKYARLHGGRIQSSGGLGTFVSFQDSDSADDFVMAMKEYGYAAEYKRPTQIWVGGFER